MSGRPEVLVVLDVESVGLFGDPIAWAAVVLDAASGAELEAVYVALEHGDLLARLVAGEFPGPADDARWVIDHVLPALRDDAPVRYIPDGANLPAQQYVARSVYELVGRFAAWWEGLIGARHAWLIADSPFPVETSFLQRARQVGAVMPYPLLDVGSALAAVGCDPTRSYTRIVERGETPGHHPLADARQSARLWRFAERRGGVHDLYIPDGPVAS